MFRTRANRPDGERRFGWRDAIAHLGGLYNLAWRRDDRVTYRSLIGVSSIDRKALPRRRQFAASDQAKLTYRHYAAQSDTHIVLIHGSACFGDQFHALAHRFSDADIAHVHTVDMRGHGGSAPATTSLDRCATDVAEFVREVRRRNPAAKIILGGHSAGGGLVLNAILRAGDLSIDGCLLLAPYLAINSPTVRPMFGGWLTKLYVPRFFAIACANLVGITRFNDRPVSRFNSEAYLHDPRFARWWSFAQVVGFDPRRALAKHRWTERLPMLVVVGTNDECFRPQAYANTPINLNPEAKIVMLPELGHWDLLTDQAAMAIYRDWMVKIGATSPSEGQRQEEREANVRYG